MMNQLQEPLEQIQHFGSNEHEKFGAVAKTLKEKVLSPVLLN
jgi:hypothetical protein